jgi:hypothetical protein
LPRDLRVDHQHPPRNPWPLTKQQPSKKHDDRLPDRSWCSKCPASLGSCSWLAPKIAWGEDQSWD